MQPTRRSRLLTAVSAAQLACGLAGMAVALRSGYAYDVFWMHGRQDTMARDSVLMGTAFSAPVSMLIAQAALTVRTASRPSRLSIRGLGVLGAAMMPGYLGERLVRQRLRPSGWNAAESPLILAGIGLAAAMAVLGSPGGPTKDASR